MFNPDVKTLNYNHCYWLWCLSLQLILYAHLTIDLEVVLSLELWKLCKWYNMKHHMLRDIWAKSINMASLRPTNHSSCYTSYDSDLLCSKVSWIEGSLEITYNHSELWSNYYINSLIPEYLTRSRDTQHRCRSVSHVTHGVKSRHDGTTLRVSSELEARADLLTFST